MSVFPFTVLVKTTMGGGGGIVVEVEVEVVEEVVDVVVKPPSLER